LSLRSFAVEDDGPGDQFMAVKPWIGAIKAPTRPPAGNNSTPDADLSLEWVYGYRCFDARNNVRKLATVRRLHLLWFVARGVHFPARS
jgi:hypothetical protein